MLLFMNGDNSLDPYTLADFNEMANVGSSNQVQLIAQIDRKGSGQGGPQDWSQTLRFRIAQGMKPIPANALADLGEVNMGSPKALEDFVSWGMTQFPAKHYALILWDHGQGFKDLATEPDVGPLAEGGAGAELSRPVVKAVFRSSQQAPHRSISNDETDHDELYNAEITGALQHVLHGRKLDVIGFDACLMSMVETAYAFRSVAHVMVGSEDLEPAEGWQYDDWIGRMAGNPPRDTSGTSAARALGELLVDSYRRRYETPPPKLLDDPTTTLAAIDLEHMEEVARAVSTLAVAMKEELPTALEFIKTARGKCSNFAPNTFGESRDEFFHIDFVHYCEQLQETGASPRIKAAAREAVRLTRGAVISSYAGAARRDAFGSSGLAIYFPSRRADYERDQYVQRAYEKENTYFPVAFVQEQQWADFLHAYLARVP